MKKFFIIFLVGLIGTVSLIGCTDTKIACELSGFHIIEDTSTLDQEILDWIHETKPSTGLYKNNFDSGNYLLITLGEHKNYAIKKVEVKEDNYGYIFNITVREGESEDRGFNKVLTSPILVKTDYADANYDIRIIYR
ncbi:hypothetical protein [Geosporobacter ferrireducens]|uniref:PrcB C-terminal domain-containing protein n=1 Tax=Geosporobacter ferrireducens TaxID=1424294 RepID=A0A1D8GFP6_9FIRM|nr:hypothetical protein [Geosporobacter ferrireducens]AOT69727.1 hypothetical protein Gferi_09110 [Geosporobacter ferrireducens]MTI54564.1 hypothetical protein [Geosporobacter ferrireducens]